MHIIDSTHPNPIIGEDVQEIISSSDLWGALAGGHVLITGASGFIASYIVETLLALNDNYNYEITVSALARSDSKFWKRFEHHRSNKWLNFLHYDVTDDLSVLSEYQFTHIVHAASQASPKFYGKDPVGTIGANTTGTSQLLNLAYNCESKSFLYISSAEVYGKTEQVPTKEIDYGHLDLLAVRSCYAESKRLGEALCVAWAHQYDVTAKIVRPFHTYGPNMDLEDGRVYADFVKNLVLKQPLTVNGTGQAIRAFCYLSDAISGVFAVLLKGESSVAYNLGNPEGEIQIKELAALLQSLYPERSPSVTFNKTVEDEFYIPSKVDRICPDIAKLQSLGWSPKVSIESGFKRTVESYLYEA